jgi:hypothetical protein
MRRAVAVLAVLVIAFLAIGCATSDRAPAGPTPAPTLAAGGDGPATSSGRVRDQWCVVSGEGTDLLHVWGPWSTKEAADAWAAGANPPQPWRVAGITAPDVR